jgi:hypothetical protein
VLADLAERSIDLQYFIYDASDIGAFVADRLPAAANRGVRVRMIIDDYQSRIADATLARLDAHQNVEIRPGPVRELPPELSKYAEAEHGPFAEYARRKEEIRRRRLQPAGESPTFMSSGPTARSCPCRRSPSRCSNAGCGARC